MSFAAVKVGNRPAQPGGKALESSPQRSLFKINLPGVTRFLVGAQGIKGRKKKKLVASWGAQVRCLGWLWVTLR